MLVAVETFGPRRPSAKSLFRKGRAFLKEVTFERRFYEYLCQRVSVAIQRGNAVSVLGTVPSKRGLDGIHYVA